ncbi:MAG: glutamine amidotransferase, partial [Alphaproteobacteria bacterium]
MKKALIIRHVPHEGIAAFRQPIEAAGYQLDRIDVSDPEFGCIDLREPDLLIMMGGPMAVYDQDRLPWIRCQLKRLALRLEQDRPTLGVCLGAQMIASALGGDVFPGPVKEVGFHKVKVADAPDDTPLRHVADQPLLHWHGDTFTLPGGTELLASSDTYQHQAFRRGKDILGLQFHAEMGLDERFHRGKRSQDRAAWQDHDGATALRPAGRRRRLGDHCRHDAAARGRPAFRREARDPRQPADWQAGDRLLFRG